jgi:hypothetical protein
MLLVKRVKSSSPFLSVSVHLCRFIQVVPARLARPSPLRATVAGDWQKQL